jgi:hypothetical protein
MPCLIGILLATLCLLFDLFTQINTKIGVILIRYPGMAVLCVLLLQYRKCGLFLRDKLAQKASFKLWLYCVIVVGLLYLGIGFGLFAAIVVICVIPSIIDVILPLFVDLMRTMISVGFFLGNAVYITSVLKWKKMNKEIKY